MDNSVLKKAVILYKYLTIKSFLNKLKNLKIINILLLLLISCCSLFFYFYFIRHSIVLNFTYNIGIKVFPKSNIGWLIVSFILFRLLWFEKVTLSNESLFLWTISSKRMKNANHFILYESLNAMTSFLFPFIVSIVFYSVLKSFYYSFLCFIFLFLLNVFTILIKSSLFLTFYNKKIIKKLINYGLVFLIVLSILSYMKKIEFPFVFYKIFYPFILVIASFVEHQNFYFAFDVYFVLFIFFLLILFVYNVFMFENTNIILGFTESNHKKLLGAVFSNNRIQRNPVINKEIKKLIGEITISSVSIVLLFSFLMSGFMFYGFFVQKNTLPLYKMVEILFLMIVTVIPTYVFLPAVVFERPNSWVYKLSQKSKLAFFHNYLVFYLIFSFLISLFFLFFYQVIAVCFSVSFVTFDFLKWYVIHSLNMFFVPLIVSFLIGVKINPFFFKQGSLKPVISIFFIWFFILVVLPYLLLMNLFHDKYFLVVVLIYNLLFYSLFRLLLTRIDIFKED